MKPLLITPGDPRGVGPEVCAKALKHLGQPAIIVADGEAMAPWMGDLPRVAGVGPVEQVSLLVPPGDEPVEVAAIRLAAEACLEGRARAMVTGPIHKARLAAQGFAYRGHTDFLAAICGIGSPVMAFAGERLRVALATTHVPLSQVSSLLSQERVLHCIRVAHLALVEQLDLLSPEIVVCGVNPHAGEGGLLGSEEIETIGPACVQARDEGIRVRGPVSAETAFRDAWKGRGDLVVAMYHDQGLAPLKLVEFGGLVNWTLGLPLIRTSVDHGTADDIAGKGIADPGSMVAAIRLAGSLR